MLSFARDTAMNSRDKRYKSVALTNQTKSEPRGKGMTERQIESNLIKSVKASGGIALKLISPGVAGVPDRLVLLPGGHAVFVELKAPGQKPRPLQRKRARQLTALGFSVFTIDSIDDIDAIQEVLKL